MITLKEAVSLLSGAKKIYIVWDGSIIDTFDPECALTVDAFGKYLVDRIGTGHEKGDFELRIAAQPLVGE